MSNSKVVDNIPGEITLNRLEELKTFCENFSESELVPIFQKEIAYLENLIDTYGV